jgi:hypothetical protein
MANKQTTAKVNRHSGDLTVQQHETDSPILPVPQLEQLQRFKPDAVDWVLNQTQLEAESRRSELRRINTLVFIERVIGQVFAFLIGIAGVTGGAYVAMGGQPWAGTVIAGAALTGLAVVFLTGKSNRK